MGYLTVYHLPFSRAAHRWVSHPFLTPSSLSCCSFGRRYAHFLAQQNDSDEMRKVLRTSLQELAQKLPGNSADTMSEAAAESPLEAIDGAMQVGRGDRVCW